MCAGVIKRVLGCEGKIVCVFECKHFYFSPCKCIRGHAKVFPCATDELGLPAIRNTFAIPLEAIQRPPRGLTLLVPVAFVFLPPRTLQLPRPPFLWHVSYRKLFLYLVIDSISRQGPVERKRTTIPRKSRPSLRPHPGPVWPP